MTSAAGVLVALALGLGAGGAILLRRRRDAPARAQAADLPEISIPAEPEAAGGTHLLADAPPPPIPSLATLDLPLLRSDPAHPGAANGELTLLAIQLHGLDRIEESLGEATRARAEREVAHAIRTSLRARDTCARLERDRLVAVLPGIDERHAPAIAERVRRTVGLPTMVTHGGAEIRMQVLIGHASSPAAGDSFPELLAAARRELDRVRDRLLPASEIDRPPSERIRLAVPWVPN